MRRETRSGAPQQEQRKQGSGCAGFWTGLRGWWRTAAAHAFLCERPVVSPGDADGQLSLFAPAQIGLDELFLAYQSCRRHKRRTINATAFEVDYEQNLVTLHQEINDSSYRPQPALAFIVDRPVKREIFAADSRDRVAHHLIINKINALLESTFIFDSYSCRIGKGTHLGIRRLDHFMRSCSANYSRPAYVLKLDIRGYFMSINRSLLYERLAAFLRSRYQGADLPLLLNLCRTVIHHNCAEHCRIRGRRSDWQGLPPDKSLLYSAPGCGLPIGNLTSQVFANFYLNPLDHFIKHDLAVRYYGRYVDDCVLVDRSAAQLRQLVPQIATFMRGQLGLTLHPRKIYLQPVVRGAQYLGAVVRPWRITIANHHYATRRLIAHLVARLSPWWLRRKLFALPGVRAGGLAGRPVPAFAGVRAGTPPSTGKAVNGHQDQQQS